MVGLGVGRGRVGWVGSRVRSYRVGKLLPDPSSNLSF